MRIQAYDLDEGLNGKINYRISYREKPETFPFEIDQDSGWITTNKALDREVQSRYDFDVIAADSGDVPASATASVVLTVLDLNVGLISCQLYILYIFFIIVCLLNFPAG